MRLAWPAHSSGKILGSAGPERLNLSHMGNNINPASCRPGKSTLIYCHIQDPLPVSRLHLIKLENSITESDFRVFGLTGTRVPITSSSVNYPSLLPIPSRLVHGCHFGAPQILPILL
ncbi:hypothetical protein RUM44_012537 [Polyplax serrata]|uniref:Uncharacterized protein n=1 Tax=Polyplax serrata TaxID=468196 RepID=A0ABR1BFN5_POLSC